ncbi:MAG: sulfatase [Mycobacteriales bacterium]
MLRPCRRLAGVSILAMAAAMLAGCTSGSDEPAAGPNIVFVLTDDLSNNLVQYMPNLKKLEAAGTALTNYYVVDSLCCPSRASIFTGEYPHNNGVFTNSGSDGGYRAYNEHGNESRSFGVALQKAGYRTGFMGKYLNGYDPVANKPAPGWTDWNGIGGGYQEFNYNVNANSKVEHYGKAPADYLTDVVSRKASAFIDGSAAARKPFLLEVATFAPHAPATPAPRDAHSFPGLRAPRSAAYGKKPANAPGWLRRIPPLTAQDSTQLDEEFRKRVQSVQAVDDMIGKLRQELRAKGLDKNTYFIFSSDNGYHLGEYQLRAGKQTAFDTDIKVPLVVAGPGVPAGQKMSQMLSSIDLAPTFEAIAGAPVASTVDGASMLDVWHGRTPTHAAEAILVEHHGRGFASGDPDSAALSSGNPTTYEAIRTATALYVEYTTGEREYYDTVRDPFELDNIASTVPATTLAPLVRALAALKTCRGAGCRAAAELG